MPEPSWKEAFPISWVDDHVVTRREFTKSLVWISGASFASGAALTTQATLSPPAGPSPAVRVARVDELPVGECRVFSYPQVDGPCLLIRTAADRFVAFGQSCTHLRCPVYYEANRNQLRCPCHVGFFDAADGRVLAGPPIRPLPRLQVERRGEELWAVGVLS